MIGYRIENMLKMLKYAEDLALAIKVIRASAIIATAIPTAGAQQADVTDAELRSAYCFAVLAHRVADLQQAPPNTEELRRLLDQQVNNYDRFWAVPRRISVVD